MISDDENWPAENGDDDPIPKEGDDHDLDHDELDHEEMDEKLIKAAQDSCREPVPEYRDMRAELAKYRTKAREIFKRHAAERAEIVADLVSIMEAATEKEPYDFRDILQSALPNAPSGPNAAEGGFARAIARYVIPADADGTYRRADLFGAAARDLACERFRPDAVVRLLSSGRVTIEGLAREGRHHRKPAYSSTYEAWEAPVHVHVTADVKRQMFLLSQFGPGLGMTSGLALWQQVPGAESPRFFEIYALDPEVDTEQQDQMSRALQCQGGQMRHPRLNRRGIK